ncbi:unnamed protein product [Chrysoparadoxa australica]
MFTWVPPPSWLCNGSPFDGERATPSWRSLLLLLMRGETYREARLLTMSLFVASLVKSAVVDTRTLSSTSMLPTLAPGDAVLVSRFPRFRPCQRDTIITFRPTSAAIQVLREMERLAGTSGASTFEEKPSREGKEGKTMGAEGQLVPKLEQRLPLRLRLWGPKPMDFTKRIVAVGGDTVEVRQGELLVNGEVDQRASYSKPQSQSWGPLLVPEHHLCVLGDNRDESFDSHLWGMLPEDRVSLCGGILVYKGFTTSLALCWS